MTEEQKKEFRTHFKKCYDDEFNVYAISPEGLFGYLDNISIPMQLPVMQKPKPKTLQAIFEIVDNIDFELAQLEDIAKGEIGDKITLLRKYIDENRVSA